VAMLKAASDIASRSSMTRSTPVTFRLIQRVEVRRKCSRQYRPEIAWRGCALGQRLEAISTWSSGGGVQPRPARTRFSSAISRRSATAGLRANRMSTTKATTAAMPKASAIWDAAGAAGGRGRDAAERGRHQQHDQQRIEQPLDQDAVAAVTRGTQERVAAGCGRLHPRAAVAG